LEDGKHTARITAGIRWRHGAKVLPEGLGIADGSWGHKGYYKANNWVIPMSHIQKGARWILAVPLSS